METTFVMIKPNAVGAGYIGRIIDRYASSRLAIAAVKMKHLTDDDCKGFYAEHIGRPFFTSLVRYMTSGPSMLIALEGENAIAIARALNGATHPDKAEPGTIRSDFGPTLTENIVHSSDSAESAEREVNYFFNEDDFVKTKQLDFRITTQNFD